MLKFSLILPVYNVEKYLPKCIESCLMQDISHEEYEIIIVIDGSPDDSIYIARNYQKKYSNIIIIKQENGGLSSARNKGLLHSKGEYIWFIDSDDYINNNILNDIYTVLHNNKLEVLRILWDEIDDQGRGLLKNISKQKHVDSNIYTGKDFMAKILNNYLYAWSFIFEKQFLIKNNFSFKDGMYFEDTDFAFSFLPKVERIKLYPRHCYKYFQRDDSIVHSINKRKFIDVCTNIGNAYKFYEETKGYKQLSSFYHYNYSCLLLFLIREIARLLEYKELYNCLKDFIKKNRYYYVEPNGSYATYAIAVIYNIIGLRITFYLLHLIYKLSKK